MKKTLSFLITGFSLFSFAQQVISPEAITGIWKLKEAGFYENNKKVKKDFDACRLQRHYIIKADSLNAKGSADIHISPNGKYLYASNRLKGDGIAVFSIDQKNGKLTKVGYQPTGIHPRNFAITPNGKLLLVANRDSDQIQVFKINAKTGLLNNTNQDIKLSMPVCIKFTK